MPPKASSPSTFTPVVKSLLYSRAYLKMTTATGLLDRTSVIHRSPNTHRAQNWVALSSSNSGNLILTIAPSFTPIDTNSARCASGGAEVFVLDGGFKQEDDDLRQHSWLRMPVGSTLSATAGTQGAMVWIKTGHLRGL